MQLARLARGGCPKLSELRLYGIENINNEGVIALSGCKTLKKLDLRETGVHADIETIIYDAQSFFDKNVRNKLRQRVDLGDVSDDREEWDPSWRWVRHLHNRLMMSETQNEPRDDASSSTRQLRTTSFFRLRFAAILTSV